MDVKKQLEQLGFYASIDALETLRAQAHSMATLAGTSTNEPKFEAFASYIPAKRAKYPHSSQLVIDIGGTSTKAGLRICDESGFEHWHILFELKNDELDKNEEGELPLGAFAFHLGERLVDRLQRIGAKKENVRTCAIVWSNAMENQLLPDGRGITGTVIQRDQYNKNEWFIEGLEDGTDLGQLFLKGFERNGIAIKTFIIANDTPLTMKALPEAHGGMVASTGLNGTIVKSYKELQLGDRSNTTVICNGEMGGRFQIDSSLVSKADTVHPAGPADTVEFLTAGRFLPDLFTEHIMQLRDEGTPALQPVQDALKGLGNARWDEYRAKDMGLLLSNQDEFLQRRNNPGIYSEYALDILARLSAEIFTRAATLCTVVAYGTVANRVDNLKTITVALDSRLAREVPIFKETFTNGIRSLSEILNKPVRCPLILPLEVEGGKISVPMQGAAHALDCLT